MNNDQLFDLCYKTVLEIQGVASGFDIAAAIWGGTLYYVTPHGKFMDQKTVEPIKIENLPLLVGYTGIKADTATLIRMVQSLHSDNPAAVDQIFLQITLLVEQAKKALKQQNWPRLGALMDENQSLLRKLQVSSIELENLIAASKSVRAMGAKLSGAGGGDCMLALVAQADQQVTADQITKVGGAIIEVAINAPGVRLEKTN
jgi:mevalonate kinase